MKIITVVGARPQFIKAAMLSRVLRNEHQEVLIHTGQHYDYNMSDIFFQELSIPAPDYNLNISGGNHGQMTGKMIVAIEEVLLAEQPEIMIVYGDTNSTLAAALAAVKLHIPICHIEAGVRMGTLTNPEEVNRVLVDRISQLLLCCTETAINNLKTEGIISGVYNTGDLMYDAAIFYDKSSLSLKEDILDFNENIVVVPKDYYLLTCHREENTGNDSALFEIFKAMDHLDAPVLYPVHPRNRYRAESMTKRYKFKNIILVQPVGYLTSLWLVKNSKKVVTDSGGLQREAWYYSRQCVTLLSTALWPETFEGNMNQLCSPIESEIVDKLSVVPNFAKHCHQFGDGHAADKIVRIIGDFKG